LGAERGKKKCQYESENVTLKKDQGRKDRVGNGTAARAQTEKNPFKDHQERKSLKKPLQMGQTTESGTAAADKKRFQKKKGVDDDELGKKREQGVNPGSGRRRRKGGKGKGGGSSGEKQKWLLLEAGAFREWGTGFGEDDLQR